MDELGDDEASSSLPPSDTLLTAAATWRVVIDVQGSLTAAPPDVSQLEDIEFIPCADRLADRRVASSAAQ